MTAAIGSFEQRLAASPATPHQRLFIRCLLQKLELPTDRIGVEHQAFFHDACIAQPPADMRVDAVLAAMRRADAKKLIGVLNQRAGGIA